MYLGFTRHGVKGWEGGGAPSLLVPIALALVLSSVCFPLSETLAIPNQLGPSDVLLLVNADSPVSISIADMYRRYYPDIGEDQVVWLSGLADSASKTATPANEIITRDQFESLIAAPVRNYLINNNMVDTIYCIITTAGMPYRIEDTDQVNYANAVTIPGLSPFPGGSDPNLMLNSRTYIDAASVESELALLFQIDPELTPGPDGPGVPLENRIVNPYHGYASGIKSWATDREILGRRTTFNWDFRNLSVISKKPRIEGEYDPTGCSSNNRIMSPADLYLVARLDGPHEPGLYPIFAVRDMLNRSADVSNESPPYGRTFAGYNSAEAALVVDSYPDNWLPISKSCNFPGGTDFLTYETDPVPPGKEAFDQYCFRDSGNHYRTLFQWVTGLAPQAGGTMTETITAPFGGTFVWDESAAVMNSAAPAFPAGAGIIGLATIGCNSGDGRPASYLISGGPGGGPMFPCAPGAVFTSIESYNAATMFTTPSTGQAKIAQFIQMGGTAAIGHAFEPGQDAIVQTEYLHGNLMRDDDGDGVGDMCLVEAAFTAIPYLSWSEVLIGDPLMRYRSGSGGQARVAGSCPTDVDGDGKTLLSDYLVVFSAFNTRIGTPKYDPVADITRDGFINWFDVSDWYDAFGTYCPGE